ncbi:hypothetical protein [Guptibacillus hwajinpoensis]|uniref:hypothetical protein n=1 Tax=Guptibacillus hwajinpoensis TaxID=208199 RepID=UPI001CFF1C8A|nr:hypothetical protein [Pseudalkalibacillus hwajinpoensis]WLR57938.1 hypothetical protein LC071_11540 [Pseudalkalibacillus hwajinpoensis]
MKNFPTLKILDLFRFLFERLDIDYPTLRRILQVKLTMDGRRPTTIMSQNMNGNKKKDSNQFLKSLWFYAFIGLTLIPILFFGDNFMFQMSLIFGVLMFLIMTAMISDFSSVLLDVRDQTVIGTRPVDRRTISAARAVHVTIYLFFLTAAIVAVPLIVGTFQYGILFGVLFVVTVFFSDLLIVALTALLYYIILKFFGGERLRDVINYVQIGLSITIVVGYQVLARAFEFAGLEVGFSPTWWNLFLPPVWFGAPFAVVLNGASGAYYYIFIALAILIPLTALWLYLSLLPTFEKNLLKLIDQTGPSKKRTFKGMERLASFITRSREEHAFYQFAGRMLKNERDLKLKIYPSLGFAMIFPFVFLYNSYSAGQSFEALASGNSYLTIYASMMMVPGIVIMLQYSSKSKGSWIYHVTPIQNSGVIIKGTLKAFLLRLFAPVFVAISAIYTFLFGVRIIPDLIIVCLIALIYSVICFRILKGTLPFSEPFESAGQSDGWKTIPFALLIPVFWVVHFILTKVPFGTWAYLLVLALILPLIWNRGLKHSE